MGFNIDLSEMSLEVFEQLLMESDLVPSRMFLKEHAEPYFKLLRNHKIRNVDELLKILKNKKCINEWADRTGIPEEYLTVLNREIKGYIRTPIKLDKMPGLQEDTIKNLSEGGIVNTLNLFNNVLTPQDRTALAARMDIDEDELLLVTKLVDLTRIRWVNHTFAYALHESGYDTTEKVAAADPGEMYQAIKKVNEERQFFPAHIGLVDINRCIEFAQLVPLDLEY